MDNNDKNIILDAIPIEDRENWVGPAIVFAGLEFSIPVLMVGGTLIGSFGFKGMLPVILFTFLCITWIGNTIGCIMGSKTGLSSSVIARRSFGATQAKITVALVIGVLSMGWWAITTAATANAFCALLGIDYQIEKTKWYIVTVIVGIVFAIPSIFGFKAMKWTDYLAVPGGLLLCIVGVYLSIKAYGMEAILETNGSGNMSFASGVTLVLGLNASQLIISADYSRHAKPKLIDNIIMPLGIILVGVPLTIIGAVMAAGTGTPDIVQVMINLGFPFWGFLVLWLASWSSQLVNNYTMGLAFSNILNVNDDKGRIKITAIGTVLSIVVALLGALDIFQNFLSLAALMYPAIAGIIFFDFFIRDNEQWVDKPNWNFMATIALIAGLVVGFYTTYVKPIGIPVIQSLLVSGVVYVASMKIKGRVAPDIYTMDFGKNTK